MIYEFRSYTLHPRTLPEFLKRWTDALEPRLELSPLATFWYTEIGPLNQVIHVWPYENALFAPSCPLQPGPYFEMRTYVLKPGGTPSMAQRWGEYLPGRIKLSPLGAPRFAPTPSSAASGHPRPRSSSPR